MRSFLTRREVSFLSILRSHFCPEFVDPARAEFFFFFLFQITISHNLVLPIRATLEPFDVSVGCPKVPNAPRIFWGGLQTTKIFQKGGFLNFGNIVFLTYTSNPILFASYLVHVVDSREKETGKNTP